MRDRTKENGKGLTVHLRWMRQLLMTLFHQVSLTEPADTRPYIAFLAVSAA
jgi:hypothetical protein